MERQWRIECPCAMYHVLSRDNNRQDIFGSDDRALVLEMIREFSYGFAIGGEGERDLRYKSQNKI